MGAQRGAQESRQNDFIKINCTFVSFFITLFFTVPREVPRMGGLPPEAFREEMARHPKPWRRVVGGIGLEPTTFTMST